MSSIAEGLPSGRSGGPAGIGILRALMPSMAASTAQRWRLDRLPIFWRAQFVGWGLFFVLDLLNRLLTYKNLPMAIVVSMVVAPCLVVLSTGLCAIYASRRAPRCMPGWCMPPMGQRARRGQTPNSSSPMVTSSWCSCRSRS